jgi:amino-acid N-acetyltransferase
MLLLGYAKRQDAETIRALLEREGLPTQDLDSARPEFVTALEEGRVIGVGALQHFGTTALLRSIAVASEWRGFGVGRIIVRELERRARALGITRLILLTQTARKFFEHQGYCAVEREDAPEAVRASAEFRTLCPATAICMAKVLAES